MINANISTNNRTKLADAKFSILIPSWNNFDYLQLCINSIRKNSFYKHQIIVHINEGMDSTREWIEAQSDIDYTVSDINIGVCYALNIARGLVKTDYILYINDDMYVCPNWDKALLDEIIEIGHPYFFISSTAIEPTFSSNCAILKDYGTDIKSFREEQLLKEYTSLPFNDWSGSTWPPNVVHVLVWDLVGGYSAEFSPGMYSDPDFSMKLWKLGIRLFKGISDSRVYHFGSKSTKRMVKNKGYYQFIIKWGMTSSVLTNYYLKRGDRYNGLLNAPQLSISLKLKNILKQLTSIFHRS